jgi:hypothetical protein
MSSRIGIQQPEAPVIIPVQFVTRLSELTYGDGFYGTVTADL